MMPVALEMLEALLVDTRQLQGQLASACTPQVHSWAMLQRWLARTERVRQIQDWIQHAPPEALSASGRMEMEAAVARLCEAMVPIGPLLEHHRGVVLQALTHTASRRHQLARYVQPDSETDVDALPASLG